MSAISDDWREGFRRALIDAMVKNGSPIRADASFYGWHPWYADAIEIQRKIMEFGIDYNATKTPTSVEWYEFMGTFYEGDTRSYGVESMLVLMNGEQFPFRWEGTMSDLILEIVRDPVEPVDTSSHQQQVSRWQRAAGKRARDLVPGDVVKFVKSGTKTVAEVKFTTRASKHIPHREYKVVAVRWDGDEDFTWTTSYSNWISLQNE